jgi:hypothetical protein
MSKKQMKNIQHRTSNVSSIFAGAALVVGCWLLDVGCFLYATFLSVMSQSPDIIIVGAGPPGCRRCANRAWRCALMSKKQMENIQQPTSNIEHQMFPRSSQALHWLLVVGCWMLDVSSMQPFSAS